MYFGKVYLVGPIFSLFILWLGLSWEAFPFSMLRPKRKISRENYAKLNEYGFMSSSDECSEDGLELSVPDMFNAESEAE